MIRKRGKSWDNFEIHETYENFGNWTRAVNGDSVSERETDSPDSIYQEGGGGLT